MSNSLLRLLAFSGFVIIVGFVVSGISKKGSQSCSKDPAGQLEEEITLNGWMNVPLTREQMSEIIFNTPSSQRYQKAMNHLGFNPSDLSGEAGHA